MKASDEINKTNLLVFDAAKAIAQANGTAVKRCDLKLRLGNRHPRPKAVVSC